MKAQVILILASVWGGVGVMGSDFDFSGELGHLGHIRATATNLQVSVSRVVLWWTSSGTQRWNE